MRRMLAVAVAVGLGWSGSVAAQMLSAGTSELKVDGLVDFQSADGSLLDIGVLYGVYLYDYVEAGVQVRLTDSDSFQMWRLGAFGQYDFDLGVELVPYVGAGLALGRYEVDVAGRSDSDTALILSGTGGAKFYLAENVAISGALVLELATEKVYPDDGDTSRTDARLELGMRFFF